jgi:hypothetical protein
MIAARWASLLSVILRLLVDDGCHYDLGVGNLDDGPGFEHENMRFFSGLNGPCFGEGCSS